MLKDDAYPEKNATKGFFNWEDLMHFHSRCNRSNTEYTVLFFNLCNLSKVNKVINDEVGDKVLEDYFKQILKWFPEEERLQEGSKTDKAIKLFKSYRDKVHIVAVGMGKDWLAKKLWEIRKDSNNIHDAVNPNSPEGKSVPIYISFSYVLSKRTAAKHMLSVLDDNCERRKKWWNQSRGLDYEAGKNPLRAKHSSRRLGMSEDDYGPGVEAVTNKKRVQKILSLCDKLGDSRYKDEEYNKLIDLVIHRLKELKSEDTAA